MKLDEYLSQAAHGESARLARAAGVSPIRITDYKVGRRVPGIEKAAAISLSTGSAVTPQELAPHVEWDTILAALAGAARARKRAARGS